MSRVESTLQYIEPAQPRLSEVPPAGDGWIHEIKFDGYRTQIVIEDGSARAFTRRGIDWSDRYAPILEAALKLKCRSAIIDGEVILPNEKGGSDFHGLVTKLSTAAHELAFIAFDLLHLDGEDLRLTPIEERREKLRRLLRSKPSPKLVFSEAFECHGADVFAAAERMGLEGIISKKRGSLYKSGNVKSWVKTKCFETGTFDVIGVDQDKGGAPIALLAEGERYRGPAFITLPGPTRKSFWRYVEANAAERSPIRGLKRKSGVWVRPGLVATVRHLRGEEMLRHATLLDLGKR